MLKDRLRKATEPAWQPIVRRLDGMLDRLGRLEGEVATKAEVAGLRAELAATRDAIWHSKVVNVGGDRVLVGSRHLGLAYLLDNDDLLIMPRFVMDGEYEPVTSAFFLSTIQEDSVCIDVGANFGYYTCLMARSAHRGRVLAFEPDPHVHGLLRDNVGINWCERIVDTVNAAVGSEEGTLTLHRRIGRSGNTSIARLSPEELRSYNEPESEMFEVPCVTLDGATEDLDRVDIIKIDVEGAEALVLEGMAETVRRHRPTVLMEWSPDQGRSAGFTPAEVADRIRALALTPHTIDGAGGIHAITVDELEHLPYQNVVLLPS